MSKTLKTLVALMLMVVAVCASGCKKNNTYYGGGGNNSGGSPVIGNKTSICKCIYVFNDITVELEPAEYNVRRCSEITTQMLQIEAGEIYCVEAD